MKHIITITGPAGSGKDTVAGWLSERYGWSQVVSYTTRGIREGETDGKEHRFVARPAGMESDLIGKENIDDVMAYTVYGGHEYWTTWSQLDDVFPNIYVIDEAGLLDLLEARASGRDILLTTIYVTADEEVRLKRGVTKERMDRDRDRQQMMQYFKYDYTIKNNKSMKALEHVLKTINFEKI